MSEIFFFLDVFADTAARLAVLVAMIGVGVIALFFTGRLGWLICEAVITAYLSVEQKIRGDRP